ncbi:Protein fantom [Dufourea novaeangliae]|uniref:Protein fantom n=1 Tax=Dufourea novaeangliae TaxID=178035 RepID=A0A154P5W3_DUFNO|nr:Protein fantom [Dufourea novaeangliae]
MADDLIRDILPVKEGSCEDTCRSYIDPRERHFVYKLDRYELEDKYLRLLEEASNLKKLSNCQDDKIRRLATKLMRVTANPRTNATVLDVFEDKNKIINLQLENSKLKDKIAVLRNQLLSHTIHGRSSSRSRNLQTRPSSGRTTCRSESSRTKIPSCHCIVQNVNDDVQARHKVEELEAQKKEMADRIAELEKELSTYAVTNQREKVAENVEYIKCWRQMKQLNDKLVTAENTNVSLNAQINDLKRMLQEATKKNQETIGALLEEKKRSSELDEEILSAKNSQLSSREKDEQIKDLTNEIKILQQHNGELIALSSTKGEIESENIELKKKVSEQRDDQESLRNAFNNEQANIVALRTSNEQLLGKLQELQKNIDSLTSFRAQTEKPEMSMVTPVSLLDNRAPAVTNKQLYESSVNETMVCTNCYKGQANVGKLEETDSVAGKRPSSSSIEKYVQTEDMVDAVIVVTKEQGTSTMTPVKEMQQEKSTIVWQRSERTTSPESSLTPQKMLKLLEQAQITAPLDAPRFSHKDMASNVDYNDILDLNQRHRQVVSLEKLLFGDSSC